jgi:hypothetical protein
MNVTTTIASFALAIRTVRGGIVTLLGHLARQINKLVTAAIARWERQATIATLSDSPTNRRRQDNASLYDRRYQGDGR